MSCGCCCEDHINETGEFPSPMGNQINVPTAKTLNRFHASGYDLCIEDVMKTIARSREIGFEVMETT